MRHVLTERYFETLPSFSNEELERIKAKFPLFYEQIENDEYEQIDDAIFGKAAKEIWSDTTQKISNLLTFMLDRLKGDLGDKGLRHDIIDAGLTQGQDDLVPIVNRVTALQSFLDTPDGENLLAGYKRAANILKAEAKKGDFPTGVPKKPSEKESIALYGALQTARPKIETALAAENYTKAMSELAVLRTPIDAFFHRCTSYFR